MTQRGGDSGSFGIRPPKLRRKPAVGVYRKSVVSAFLLDVRDRAACLSWMMLGACLIHLFSETQPVLPDSVASQSSIEEVSLASPDPSCCDQSTATGVTVECFCD